MTPVPRMKSYFVMPYIEGETLRDKIEREQQMAVDEALHIAREVADALAYAHARGGAMSSVQWCRGATGIFLPPSSLPQPPTAPQPSDPPYSYVA